MLPVMSVMTDAAAPTAARIAPNVPPESALRSPPPAFNAARTV